MIVEKAYGDYTDFRIPGIVATGKGLCFATASAAKRQAIGLK